MRKRSFLTGLTFVTAMGMAAGRARAQAFLADDIVIISKGTRNKEKARTESQLGPAPGAGGSAFRTGPAAPSPPGVLSAAAGQLPNSRPHPGIAPPAPLPSQGTLRYGPVEIPALADEGPPEGLTLDQAIDRLVHMSYALRTKFQEIPQAEADILSAGLRANPLVFFSANSVPYGQYTPQAQGSTNYGITWVQPLDLNQKRRARLEVAQRAKVVLEAQYQDAVRLEIDNVYTAYVDVLNARTTVRSVEASLSTLEQTLRSAEEQYRKGEVPESSVDDAVVQRDTAAMAHDQAVAALRQAKRTLATILAIPLPQADGIELRATIRDAAPPPPAVEELARIALAVRPDLAAYRLGVGRAEADVKLAKANRFEDVFLLATPYGYMANNFDPNLKGTTSWSLGVLASLPLVNRNQGNIARARGNVVQTQIQLTGQEQQVVSEVERAALEYDSTLATVQRLERSMLPRAKHSRDDKYRLFTEGQENIVLYLNAQRNYQDVVRQYLDTLILHRRSMLRLNTAVGQRILP